MPGPLPPRIAACLGLLVLGACLPTDTEEAPSLPVVGRAVNGCHKPVEGVEVTLQPDRRPQQPFLRASTGADGRFRFDGVRGYAAYRLRLHLPDGMTLPPAQGPDVRVSVGNVPPAAVEFRVHDPGRRTQATLFVAPQTRTCTTWYGLPFQCLLVREGPDARWWALSGIRDFQHEPGFAYQLRVERHDDPCPPADGPSFTYRLLSVVSRWAEPD